MKKKRTKEMQIVSPFPLCPVCHMGLPWLLTLKEAMEVFGISSEKKLFKLADAGKIDMAVRQGRGRGLEYNVVIYGVQNFPRKVHKLLKHIDWGW